MGMDRETGDGIQLGKWVRARRDALGMSQEDVWRRMEVENVAANWISKLETGRVRYLPDHELLHALSVALRVPVTEVLRGAGVLPVDVEAAQESAPGSATIHALVDMIDWTDNPANRQNVEGLLQLILERQKP
jgi:transcriptional regulator with XRE-family HTH domain